MKRTAFISMVLLLLMGTILTGCGEALPEQGQIMLTVAVPSGPSAYPGLPWPGHRVAPGTREIPPGTSYIDIEISKPGFSKHERIEIDGANSVYTCNFNVPAGSGYTIEVAAADWADVESLTAGFVSGVTISDDAPTTVQVHLQRFQFALVAPPPASVTSGQNISLSGEITSPWNLNSIGVESIGALFQNPLKPSDYFYVNMTAGLPDFTSGTPTYVDLSGRTPNVSAATNYQCRAIGINYTHPLTDHSWVFVIYQEENPFAQVQVLPVNLSVVVD